MNADRERLAHLLTRLRDFDLRLPPPHERGIVEVARMALREEISVLASRLREGSYWRRSLQTAAARA
jgi:hypothetical protein